MQFFNLTFETADSPKDESDSKAGVAGGTWGPLAPDLLGLPDRGTIRAR